MAEKGNNPVIHCLYDSLLNPSELVPHPKNRNKHSKPQIKRLAKIIEYQGWRYAIKVSKKSGLITSGHGRREAALLHDWQSVPVVFQDYESDEQEYSDVQADNAIASWAELDLSGINLDVPDLGPDFDIDLLGIQDFAIEPADKYQEGENNVPVARETNINKGDIFLLGQHRLMCGDSTDSAMVSQLMNGERADMVYTDPPYGISHAGDIGVPGAGWSGDGRKNKYKPIENDQSVDVAKAVFKLISAEVKIFWGANFYCSVLDDECSWIVWDKKIIGENYSACELAWTNQKGRIKKFEHQWHGMIKGSEMGEARIHPTQKPVALAEWCFSQYEKIESVLDPFLGSGSTLIACEKTNRKCFGMEIDPQYCQVIIDRWEKFTGKKAEKLD